MSPAGGSLQALEQVARNPLPLPEAPAGLVGVACSYAPLEVLHAAGLVPVRLRGLGVFAPAADAWLPPFTCPVVRGILGAALQGQLNSLAAVLIPHTCDSMQELTGIWRALCPGLPLLTPVEPLHVESERAHAYLRQELLSVAGALARQTGRPIRDEALAESIALYNRLRQAVRRLDALRDRMSAAEAWAAISAAWQMPPEAYLALAEGLAQALEAAAPRSARGPRLLLTGSVLDEPLIPEIIDGLGGRVVGDDLCNGTRDVQVLASEGGDPWSALAARMLQRAPCPAKHAPAEPWAGRPSRLAAERGAQGVVHIIAKFCDPHGFDAVPLSRALAANGQARLLLEVEAVNAPEQLRGRLQAFLEMLSAGP